MKDTACQYSSKDGKAETRGQNLKDLQGPEESYSPTRQAGWETAGDEEGLDALGSTCRVQEQRPSASASHVMWKCGLVLPHLLIIRESSRLEFYDEIFLI